MRKILFLTLFVLIIGTIFPQDFGFGFDEDASSSPTPHSLLPTPHITGEIEMDITPYVHDFDNTDNPGGISFWDMVSGKLNVSLSGSHAEAFAHFNLHAAAISELWEASPNLSDPSYTPLIIDEAFLRAFIGPVHIAAGLRKLTWGKADVLGPLDVTNPIDYTDLRNITDIKTSKIARPMLHVTWNTGDFSKLEGVFIPNFAGHRFASKGRWAPAQYTGMMATAEAGIFARAAGHGQLGLMASNPAFPLILHNVKHNLVTHFDNNPIAFPSTGGLEYFQAGLRYTTTIKSIDLGGQYFYGNLFRPSFTVSGVDAFLDDLPASILSGGFGNPDILSPQIKYNRYHQIGVDYAQVLFTLNVRAELAMHFTEDLAGDDGSVQNPFIGWSLGFDRDLFWGINANVQCNQTIRLLHRKVGDNPILDAEAGSDATATRLTMQLSKKFFRDNLENKATIIWDIENSDCYIIPALVYTMGNMSTELSAGIFAGKESGELGQYWENSFVRLRIKFLF